MRGYVPFVALCLALAACSTPTQPDLARLYRINTVDNTPVIVIPGVFGSRLRDRTTGAEVWPGSWNKILFDTYRDIALEFDAVTLAVRPDNLEAYGIADHALGQDFYGNSSTRCSATAATGPALRARPCRGTSAATTSTPMTGGRTTSKPPVVSSG